MELAIVTQPEYFDGEAAMINRLFESGARLLHLRKPTNDEAGFRQLMEEIDPAYYPFIALHQHHSLALEFGIGRLHFTEYLREQLRQDTRKELVANGWILSSSVHRINDLGTLQDYSYVLFGPVFNSISKAGYNSRLQPGFTLPPHEIRVFAIGGVAADNLAAVQQMGFDGAAVLGTIWQQPSAPAERLINVIKSINEIR